MSRIQNVVGRQIFDSNGNPAVEVEVTTSDGVFRGVAGAGGGGRGIAALEARDSTSKQYLGRGVMRAVDGVNGEIAEMLEGMDPTDQEGLDQALVDLDGTPNKARLGANALAAVSMAVCRAGAAKKGLPLFKHINGLAGDPHMCVPVPAMNVLSGGVQAFNRMAVQEIMIVPMGASTFAEAMRMCTEVYHTLKRMVRKKYGYTAVGDEGGFAPPIGDHVEALKLVRDAIATAGYAEAISLAMDIAATELFKPDVNIYDLDFKKPNNDKSKCLSPDQLLTMYKHLCVDFDIVSIEDPFHQSDFTSFARMTKELGEVVQVVGDDLLVSDPHRIDHAVAHKSGNALLLKPNQIGTVSEAIEACHRARHANWAVMVSHTSGDTEDTFIADFAVGLGAGQIKAGAPCRSERVAKYNQLLRIEQELDGRACFPGDLWREPHLVNEAQRSAPLI